MSYSSSLRAPSIARLVTTFLASVSIDSISPWWNLAGAKMRRAGLAIVPGSIRPTTISLIIPWMQRKLSRDTTVTSSFPALIACLAARQKCNAVNPPPSTRTRGAPSPEVYRPSGTSLEQACSSRRSP